MKRKDLEMETSVQSSAQRQLQRILALCQDRTMDPREKLGRIQSRAEIFFDDLRLDIESLQKHKEELTIKADPEYPTRIKTVIAKRPRGRPPKFRG